jgi:hypothetical protein
MCTSIRSLTNSTYRIVRHVCNRSVLPRLCFESYKGELEVLASVSYKESGNNCSTKCYAHFHPPIPRTLRPKPNIFDITFNLPKRVHNLHKRKTTSSSSPPVSPDSGKRRLPDVGSSDTLYSHAAIISIRPKRKISSRARRAVIQVRRRTRVGSLATSVVTPAVSEADFCKSLRYTSGWDAISE